MADTKTNSTIATIKKYAKLYEERDKARAKEKALTAEIDQIGEQVVSYFEQHGITSQKIGGRIVGIRREVWARLKPDSSIEDVREAFGQLGIGHLVKAGVNVQSLSAWVREEMEAERWPPQSNSASAVIDVAETFKAYARKA